MDEETYAELPNELALREVRGSIATPGCRVRELVVEHTQGRMAGLLGEPRVNVLALNMALDEASK